MNEANTTNTTSTTNEKRTGKLANKVALVTGGSRGIGRAIALALAKEGAHVVVNYAGNQAAAEETAQLITDVGGIKPMLLQFDVAQSSQVDEGFAKIKEQLGTVHILVNNAGISKDGLLLRYKDDDWMQTINTNLSGTFYCARAAAKLMIKNRWGRIVNLSSVVGETGNAGQVSYSAAKAGVLGMTKTLARELASRAITVNAITPGYIETDMNSYFSDEIKKKMLEEIPLGYAGQADDIAAAVAFLVSEDARYITGHTLAVNGGMHM